MLEVGRAQKTIFACRYLRIRELQREIEDGLKVVESFNRANSVIGYGNTGLIASNRRDEQEMFVLCLRILHAALVYVNTLMLQDVLADPAWADRLTEPDRRGLTQSELSPCATPPRSPMVPPRLTRSVVLRASRPTGRSPTARTGDQGSPRRVRGRRRARTRGGPLTTRATRRYRRQDACVATTARIRPFAPGPCRVDIAKSTEPGADPVDGDGNQLEAAYPGMTA